MATAKELLATWPDRAGPAREAAILRAFRGGHHPPLVWAELTATHGADTVTLFVTADALKVGDATDSVRVTTTARTAQRIADLFGCVLQTPSLCDLVWEHASVRLAPSFQTADARMSDTPRMVAHSNAVDEKRRGRAGLVENVGKHWVLTNALFARPGRAANYGWFDSRAPNRKLWQSLGTAHDLDYVDYSQVVRLVQRGARLNGSAVDIGDPRIAWAVSSEGPLLAWRLPGVAEEARLLGLQTGTDTQPLAVLRALRLGSAGPDVEAWQAALIGAGHNLLPWGADGEFGRITQRRTIEFQLERGLTPDGVVGPDTRTAMAALKAFPGDPAPSAPAPAAGLSLGTRCVDWCRREMARENPPSAKTKALWFAHAERNGKKLGISAGNHCAIAQSVAALESARADDTIPHRPRAAAKELRSDAQQGKVWHPIQEVLSGRYRPRVGDLAIYDRSQPGRAETAWWGHVDRVTRIFESSFENIGANEGPGGAWQVQTTDFAHPKLLGFVEYPGAPLEGTPTPPTALPAADDVPADEGRAEVELEAEYVLGIDVSHHNGAIEWSRVAAAGHRFAFCKATEGVHFEDPRFDDNWRGMRDAGLLRSAYHFADPTVDPREQAKHFFSVVGKLGPGDLPPVLDLEKVTSLSPGKTVDFALRCLEHIEALFDARPIFYTYPGYWGSALGGTDRLKDYLLWEAHYTSAAQPLSMTPWRGWTLWQYTNKGRVPGIAGNVDVNRFRGGLDELRGLARLPPTGQVETASGAAIESAPAGDAGGDAAFELVLPTLDLRKGAVFGDSVPTLQALLLARGYGPDGLVDVRGLPDGHAGPRTAQFVKHFRAVLGLSEEPIVDGAVWRALLETRS
jgi:GH25 family lysozyme M1 (1,4-beta-N-acetylmuramidase)/peptidoglycan hydrolase-like protein with peptidoglycan-binding domain